MKFTELFAGLLRPIGEYPSGDELPQGLAAMVQPLETIPLHEVVIDSRDVVRGDCFVALPGEHVNGHDYVGHALGRGAQVVLIHEDLPRDDYPDTQWLDLRPAIENTHPLALPTLNSRPCVIRVENTLAALQRLAAFWRAKYRNLRVVGITGSVGKTSTKELLAQVLSQHFHVLKTEGNQNNEIGVPLSLLKLTPEHEYAVVEMGMYARGEIALLARLAQPVVGVVTMVAPVHLGRLGSIEAIAQAKAELIEALPPQGLAVLNDDDERVRAMRAVSKAPVMTYGLTPHADVWADDIASYGLDGIEFTVHQGQEVLPMHVPLLGRHSVHTALGAALVARHAGLDWAEILEGFLIPSPQLRLAVVDGPFGSLVLDDTYNASLESTLAALNLLEEVNGGSGNGTSNGNSTLPHQKPPRVAVLGDMLELGETEMEAHREVGCRAGVVAQYVVCVGERARWIAEEAIACGASPDHVWHVADNASALAVLHELLHERSIILVKGSRGMSMDEIVTGLATMADTNMED